MADTGLTPNTRVEIADDVLVQAIEGGAVILNPERGLYYDLKDGQGIAGPMHFDGRPAPLLAAAAVKWLLPQDAEVQD
jgi:hypothetical protein